MINAGVDLYSMCGVLGHKSAVSTKRYSHLATHNAEKRRVVDWQKSPHNRQKESRVNAAIFQKNEQF